MSLRTCRWRTNPARFNAGDIVRIRPVIFSRFAGRAGSVIRVHTSHAGTHTLDKYAVSFSDGSQGEFWDVQLETAVDDQDPSPPSSSLEATRNEAVPDWHREIHCRLRTIYGAVQGFPDGVPRSGGGRFFKAMFRVGILDAHEDTRSLLRLWLEGKYDITDYSRAEELLADLPKQNFHLLLLDLKLKMADGSEVMSSMKTMPGPLRPVAIAMTASAFKADRERAIKNGFNDLLVKPLDALRLQATIQKYLR
jgi:two-component system, cell cycle response regulator DivK